MADVPMSNADVTITTGKSANLKTARALLSSTFARSILCASLLRAEDGKDASDYKIKNPKSVGMLTTSLNGGMTLEEWDIEDDKFYENEGKTIMNRNLWASIPNLLMGFAVWLMWSVTAKRIQLAHDTDPSAYYFKDFAGEFQGVSDGFRALTPPRLNLLATAALRRRDD